MVRPPSTIQVLVVEDDAGVRGMLELALAERGYAVEAIPDRREGWNARPDVVVLDQRLASETAAGFLAHAGLGDTPIVLVTAEQSGARVAAELRVAAYVAKPFDLDVLFAAIEDAAESAGSR